MNPLEILREDQRSKFVERMAKAMAGESVSSYEEYVVVAKDKTEYWSGIDVRFKHDFSGGITGANVVGVDITEKKKTEAKLELSLERLERINRMDSLGTFAGGVAHDLNNVLTGVVSYPDFLLMDMTEDNPLYEGITLIRESGQKAAAIVQDLSLLARKAVPDMKVLNLGEIVTAYMGDQKHQEIKAINPDVNFELYVESDLLNIEGSRAHIKNAIMNLTLNAAEAITDKGIVKLSVTQQSIDSPIRGYDQVEKGDYVVFTVTDSGQVVSPENIKKIFEPFYAKKVMERHGTGLGMANVWHTVNDHKGYIDIVSGEEGTAINLYFPVSIKARSTHETKSTTYTGNGELILIVDDQEIQRDVGTGIFTELGYRAKAVPSGQEAIKWLETNKADLIVMDMRLENTWDGLDTYIRALEINPDQKAIIVSGDSETTRVQEAIRLGAHEFVQKPYTVEKIGGAASRALYSNKT